MRALTRVATGLIALLCLVGCDANGPALFVDIRTDLVPGIEFTVVRAELSAMPIDATDRTLIRSFERDAVAMGTPEEFLSGVRAASLRADSAGTYWLEIVFLDDSGREVVSRPTLLDMTGNDRGITIPLTRDCVGVECPGSGPPAALACLAGTCVDPRCHPQSPEFCPDTGRCFADTDCSASPECARARCSEGTCYVVAMRDRCAATEWCHPERGCEALPSGTRDSGVPALSDAGPPGDGGGSDDAGCARVLCDTGVECEIGFRTCDGTGACRAEGTAIDGTACGASGMCASGVCVP